MTIDTYDSCNSQRVCALGGAKITRAWEIGSGCLVGDDSATGGNSSQCRANITVALCRPVKKSHVGSVRRRLCSHGAHTSCPLEALEEAQICRGLFLFRKSHAAV